MMRSLTVVAEPVPAEGFARRVSEVVPLALRAVAPRIAVPIAGATLAVTVAVTMVIRWRAALPWRRALRQLLEPDGAGISLTIAAAMAGTSLTTAAAMATVV